jgi:hypothetical protein
MSHLALTTHLSQGANPARNFQGSIVGAYTTVDNLSTAAVSDANAIQHQTIGTSVARPQPNQPVPQPQPVAAVAQSGEASPADAVHTTLYPYGKGGHVTKADETQCDKHHHRKFRLASVATPFRTHEEFLWFSHQSTTKDSMHGSVNGQRIVNPAIAEHATASDVDTQRRQAAALLAKANQAHVQNVDVDDTFSTKVGANVVGGKAYWHQCFLDLITMAIEYGVPPFFVTLTANECGWEDIKRACDNDSFSKRPIDATRQYHHRWQEFKKTYLSKGTKSPLGTIEQTWFRQEDQHRGSLHVHMAVWIKAEDGLTIEQTSRKNATNICGTAPRASDCTTPAVRAWRSFVLHVQKHTCRPKCRMKNGEFQGN